MNCPRRETYADLLERIASEAARYALAGLHADEARKMYVTRKELSATNQVVNRRSER